MAILNFSDVLKKVGLDPKRVKLIRHSLTDREFRKCYEKNMVMEYTCVQSDSFTNGYDYWCVFVSDKSTTAKFFVCYKVNGCVPDTQDVKPDNFPLEDWFQGQKMFYELEHIDLLKEYEGRLLIEWGNSALAWAQKATNEKPIVAIQDKRAFSGYENFILTYDELKKIAMKLVAMGPSKIVITGIQRGHYIGNYCYEKNREDYLIKTMKVGTQRSGTGDIFASIITADAVNGVNFHESVRKASTFIKKCILKAIEMDIPLTDGVPFEELLSTLK